MQRFARLLASEFPKRGIHAETIVPRAVFGRLRPNAYGLGKWLGYIDKFALFPRALMRRIRQMTTSGSDRDAKVLVHICDHSNSHYSRYLKGVSHLVTCHDLLAVRMAADEFGPRRTSATGRHLQAIILRGLRCARHIACVSEATRRHVLRLTQKDHSQVSLIHNGLNHPYVPIPKEQALARVAELVKIVDAKNFRYILHVGGNQWYKNRLGVLKIFAQARKRSFGTEESKVKLLMAGPSITDEMRHFLKQQPEIVTDIVPLGVVERSEDLQALYAGAEMLLFPSVEEGFGWPIIEAQACGCRVVTTQKAPMTEVGGCAVTYIDPPSYDGNYSEPLLDVAAEAVLSILRETASARQNNREAGIINAMRFSTDKMIAGYLELYRQQATLR